MITLEELTKKEDLQAEILKLLAPGTELRLGLDNILKAKTGALIVLRRFKRYIRLSRWRFCN